MPAPIPPPEIDWVPLSVFGTPGCGTSGFGAQIEIAITTGGRAASPFVSLARGRFSNVWLGRVAIGGTPVRYLAIKSARDNYVGEAGSGLASPSVDNREVAEMWEREKDALLQLQRQGVVRVFGFEGDGPFAIPTVFCEARRLFFAPLDADSLEPLVPCRDADRLAALGLGHPETSLARYLVSNAPRPDGADRAYTWSTAGSPVAGRDDGKLATGPELFASWSRIFQRELDFEATARLERGMPCWFCADQAECYGPTAPKAGERLSPLAFYGGPAIVSEALPLHVDEAAAVLGGAALGDLFPAAFGPGMLGRQLLLHDVDRRLAAAVTTPGARLWFAARGTPEHAREVLYLKLELIRRVAAVIRQFHGVVQRPLFDLSPASFMVDLARDPGSAPLAWTAVPQLVDPGAQHRYRPASPLAPAMPPGWLPSLDVDPVFCAPWIPTTAPDRRVRMTFTVGRTADRGEVRELSLRGQPNRQRMPDDVRPGDFVRIEPDGELSGIGSIPLVGVVEADGIALDPNEPVRLRILPGEPLGRHRGELPVHFEGEARFFPRLETTCDLFGFALLAFRLLLWNDELDARAATELGRQSLDTLRYRVAEGRDASSAFASRVVDELIGGDHVLSDPRSVLFHAADRATSGTAIDAGLWADTLRTLARIGTVQAGFGFAADRSDVDPRRPGDLFARVESELADLALRARDALFVDEARQRELFEACVALGSGRTVGGAG